MSLVKCHHRNSSTSSFSAASRRKPTITVAVFIRSVTATDALLDSPGELNTAESGAVFDLWFEKKGESMSVG